METYTCWNLHERQEGRFDFSGGLDVARFVQTAQKLGLYVILRPGPYICAEMDFGGLPSWLLNRPGLALRCNNPLFLQKVAAYYKQLFDRLRPYLGENGGNIIAVQVENEYGSYGNDKDYLRAVAQIYRDNGVNEFFFTSDGPNQLMLGGGSAEEPETAAASPATERTSPAAPAPWETDGTASGTGGWEIRGNSFAGAGADRQTGPTSAGETLRLVLARKRAEWQYTAAFGPAGTGETADSAGRRNPMTEDGGLSDGGGATMPGGGEAEETFYFLPGRRDSGAAGMMESARALSRTVQRDARRYDGGFPLYD